LRKSPRKKERGENKKGGKGWEREMMGVKDGGKMLQKLKGIDPH